VRTQAVELLRDAASLTPLALIVSAADPAPVQALLRDAGWADAPVLAVSDAPAPEGPADEPEPLSTSRSADSETAEVNA
jgi:ABC-type sugar transport system substrate-binding protein